MPIPVKHFELEVNGGPTQYAVRVGHTPTMYFGPHKEMAEAFGDLFHNLVNGHAPPGCPIHSPT